MFYQSGHVPPREASEILLRYQLKAKIFGREPSSQFGKVCIFHFVVVFLV